ncbi:hypothetical protein MYX07_02320, partial [Patescibacteria group bacterium AH-259-L07]|nr:hypothetical protein [Patescibacteria group bacterium AH-259-L07]
MTEIRKEVIEERLEKWKQFLYDGRDTGLSFREKAVIDSIQYEEVSEDDRNDFKTIRDIVEIDELTEDEKLVLWNLILRDIAAL